MFPKSPREQSFSIQCKRNFPVALCVESHYNYFCVYVSYFSVHKVLYFYKTKKEGRKRTFVSWSHGDWTLPDGINDGRKSFRAFSGVISPVSLVAHTVTYTTIISRHHIPPSAIVIT